MIRPFEFRLVRVRQVGRWGTVIDLLVGPEFAHLVSVRVECRPCQDVSSGAMSYVLDERGPRSPKTRLEAHAVRVAEWLTVGGTVPS